MMLVFQLYSHQNPRNIPMCHGFKIALYVHVTLDLIIICMVFPSSSPTNGVSDASGSLIRTWFSLKIRLYNYSKSTSLLSFSPPKKKTKKKKHVGGIFHGISHGIFHLSSMPRCLKRRCLQAFTAASCKASVSCGWSEVAPTRDAKSKG